MVMVQKFDDGAQSQDFKEEYFWDILSILECQYKAIVNTIICRDFMSLCWELALEIINWVSITNRGWHTQVEERWVNTYSISASNEYRIIDNIMD